MSFHFPLSIEIAPRASIAAQIKIPGSKSYSNRALLLAMLAEGKSVLENILESEDTAVVVNLLKNWNIPITNMGNTWHLVGLAGNLPAYNLPIYLENAGTAVRFLTAILTLGPGPYILDGNSRMRERPIYDLLAALNAVGCKIAGVEDTYLPLTIQGGGFPGGKVEVYGGNSSQYASAILMAAPYGRQATELTITGDIVSHTYLDMTVQAMLSFGVKVDKRSERKYFVPSGQCYHGRTFSVEADASSASYFLAIPAITGGEICIENLSKSSLQGDLGFINLLEAMGCKVKWAKEGCIISNEKPLHALGTIDMRTMSDVAPTMAVVALFSEGETVITKVENMRIKECDRISAMATELRKLGAVIAELPDGWRVLGCGWPKNGSHFPLKGNILSTYNDHRMAMALSLTGLKVPGVTIDNPACVQKTFPTFFELFGSL